MPAAGCQIALISIVICGLACLQATPADALVPPDWEKVAGTHLPETVFIDRSGKEIRLSDMKGAILILQPMFTRCPGVCSVVAARLAQALNGLSPEDRQNLRVVSFSFDPDETQEGLAKFEKEFGVDSATWKVVRGRPAEIQRLLAALDFRTMLLGQANFEHPDLVFVVDRDGVVRDYIPGTNVDAVRLSVATRLKARGSWMTTFKPLIPAIALLGLAVSVFVLVHSLTKKHKEFHKPH